MQGLVLGEDADCIGDGEGVDLDDRGHDRDGLLLFDEGHSRLLLLDSRGRDSCRDRLRWVFGLRWNDHDSRSDYIGLLLNDDDGLFLLGLLVFDDDNGGFRLQDIRDEGREDGLRFLLLDHDGLLLYRLLVVHHDNNGLWLLLHDNNLWLLLLWLLLFDNNNLLLLLRLLLHDDNLRLLRLGRGHLLNLLHFDDLGIGGRGGRCGGSLNDGHFLP